MQQRCKNCITSIRNIQRTVITEKMRAIIISELLQLLTGEFATATEAGELLTYSNHMEM